MTDCKVNPTNCLHPYEIGSTHLQTQELINSKTHICAYFLHFPNRSWLRSFQSPWGLGAKTDERKAFEVERIDNLPFYKYLRCHFEHSAKSRMSGLAAPILRKPLWS